MCAPVDLAISVCPPCGGGAGDLLIVPSLGAMMGEHTTRARWEAPQISQNAFTQAKEAVTERRSPSWENGSCGIMSCPSMCPSDRQHTATLGGLRRQQYRGRAALGDSVRHHATRRMGSPQPQDAGSIPVRPAPKSGTHGGCSGIVCGPFCMFWPHSTPTRQNHRPTTYARLVIYRKGARKPLLSSGDTWPSWL